MINIALTYDGGRREFVAATEEYGGAIAISCIQSAAIAPLDRRARSRYDGSD